MEQEENHNHNHNHNKHSENENETETEKLINHNNTNSTSTWGTWEELILAFAVERHGFDDWEAVASEVQASTSLPVDSASADVCHRKYMDLNRRYAEKHRKLVGGDDVSAAENGGGCSEGDGVPWLEELRRLRVAELKRAVHNSDVSILSLELKVKRLEEERKKSLSPRDDVEELQEEDNINKKPKVESTTDLERSENDKRNHDQESKPSGSHREEEEEEEEEEEGERSVNESNSTGSGEKKGEVNNVKEDPDPVMSGSGSKREEAQQVSSEVQSSASLGKRKRKERSRRWSRERGDGIGVGTGGCVGKSEPLVAGLLEMIRAHKYGSLFENRLQSQETDMYKSLVRQHLDLETIELRLEQGSYYSHPSFFRDLLLLFNNAILFFPKHANESVAAHELRSLVSSEMKNETQKSDSTLAPSNVSTEPKSELQKPDLLLSKHKPSVPLVVCRKRSSMSGKPSTSSMGQKIEQERQQKSNENKPTTDVKLPVEKSVLKLNSDDKPVTGARSSRRINKAIVKGNSSPMKKQTSPPSKVGSADKHEGPKTDKKKAEALALDKKRSAADFLKRIKTSSPVDAVKKNGRGGNNSSGVRKRDNSGEEGKGKEKISRKNTDKRPVKEKSSPSKGNGRSSKKVTEAHTASVSGKRGRDGGGKETARRPKKRTRI